MWLLAVGLLIGAPLAVAVLSETLNGDVVFAALEARRLERLGSSSISAVSFFPETSLGNVNGWALDAQALRVNWTRQVFRGIGWSPGSNDSLMGISQGEFTGEDRFSAPSVSFSIQSKDVNLLLVSDESRNVLWAGRSGVAVLTPSAGERWSGGVDGRNPDQSPEDKGRLRGVFVATPGTPVVQLSASSKFHISGNFSLFVWESMVNVTDEDGTVTSYRSGTWDTDVVGSQAHPGGVTRETHRQLLRLDAVDGILVLNDWSGLARIAAESLDAHAEGSTVFRQARAYLESPAFYYRTDNASFDVDGSLSLTITRNPASTSELWARLEARSAKISLPPSGPLPAPAIEDPTVAEARSKVDGQGLPSHALRNASLSEIILWAVPGALLFLAGWAYLRRRRALEMATARYGPVNMGPAKSILSAEEALVRGESARARALVEPIVRQDPLDVDAWFIHGASLLQEGAPRRAALDLEPVVKKIRGNRAGLAFLLCLAYVKLGRWPKARRWSLVAGTDPDFRLQLERDETFAPLRTKATRPTAGASPLGAPSPAVDVAYG